MSLIGVKVSMYLEMLLLVYWFIGGGGMSREGQGYPKWGDKAERWGGVVQKSKDTMTITYGKCFIFTNNIADVKLKSLQSVSHFQEMHADKNSIAYEQVLCYQVLI